jgi:hypothetical protein
LGNVQLPGGCSQSVIDEAAIRAIRSFFGVEFGVVSRSLHPILHLYLILTRFQPLLSHPRYLLTLYIVVITINLIAAMPCTKRNRNATISGGVNINKRACGTAS